MAQLTLGDRYLNYLSKQHLQSCQRRLPSGRWRKEEGDRNEIRCWKSLSSLSLRFTPLFFSWISAPGLVANIIKFFTRYVCLCAKSLQLCPTLCDPMNCSLPGSSVHGILQERILEWVAMSSSRGSSQTRDQTCVSYISCIGRQVLYQ